MNKRATQVSMAMMILGAILLGGCQIGPARPQGALGVAELLEAPIYGSQVQVYGQVSQLGELRCPCFALTDDGETLFVWYDLMIEEDETQRPSVGVEGITNGDWVVVTGELRSTGSAASDNVFWAASIEVIE